MNISDEERYRTLKNKHQQLYADWKQNHRPCIICGEQEGNEDDHLPPKVLYPKKLRSDKTYFFTFRVCSDCNRGSSDEDFLFSVLLSIGLNQDVYLKNEEPTDPDLLALHQQIIGHLQDSPLATYQVNTPNKLEILFLHLIEFSPNHSWHLTNNSMTARKSHSIAENLRASRTSREIAYPKAGLIYENQIQTFWVV